jgi:CSLREA domain-containing protein/uncharacterized repeat protein (TIGR01451 family)
MVAFVIAGVALVGALSLSVVTPETVGVAQADTVITVTTTTDELNSDGDCSLREAIQAANTDAAVDACPAGSGADTIVLSPTTTYPIAIGSTNEDANDDGDFDILDDLTIQGNGATVDGDAIERVFDINGDGSVAAIAVEFWNITITGGDSGNNSDNGGGIRAINADVEIWYSNILTNTASTSYYGGGLYMDNDTGDEDISLNVYNSTFAGNSADYGGGIYADSSGTGTSHVGVYDSTLENNTSDGDDGAAMYLYGSTTASDATIDIHRSYIINNNSAYYAGGVYFADSAIVDIAWSHIDNNTAVYDAGGLYFSDSGIEATISDSSINGNAVLGDLSNYPDGGGIYVSDINTLDIYRSTVNNNLVDIIGVDDQYAYGGGISIESGAGDVTIHESDISGNTVQNGDDSGGSESDVYGGGIYARGNSLEVIDSTISRNTADASDGPASGNDGAYGGGIYYSGGTLVISNTTISGNSAEGGDNGNEGGGIYVDNTAGEIYYSTIAENNADDTGGGIFQWNGAEIYATIVANNTAGTADTENCDFTNAGPAAGSDNISEDSGTTNGCDSDASFASGTAPLVGALANNGGWLETHLPDNEAIDGVATASLCDGTVVDHDERGVPRPTGVDSCDIGAVEIAVTDLTITKTLISDDMYPAQNDTVVFEIEVGNSGSEDAYDVVVEDTLNTDAIDWTSWSSTPTGDDFDTSTGWWDGFDVAAGSTETLWITGTVNSGYGGETITNTATISNFANAGESTIDDPATANIYPSLIEFVVDKSFAPDEPAAGEEVVYTIYVENTSAYTAHNVVIWDTLPVSLTDITASPTPDSEDPHIWTFDTLGAGEAVSIVVTGTLGTDTLGVTVTNVVYVYQDDEATVDSEAFASATFVPVEPTELSLSKSAYPDNTPRLGEEFTFILSIINSGSTTETVVVTDAIDSRFDYNSYDTETSTPISQTVTYTNGVVTWTATQLPAGASAYLYLDVTPNTYTNSLVITNTAYLVSPAASAQEDSAAVTIGKAQIYLPLIMKNHTAN